MNKPPVHPSGGLVQGGPTTPDPSIVSSITGSLDPTMDREWILQQLQLLGAPIGVQIIEDLSIQACMAVDLANPLKPILLINPDMCFKKMKSTPIEMVIVLSHEMNHVREEARWRSTFQGQKEYVEHIDHLESKGYLGGSYHTLYNCLRDVRVNAMTIQRYTTRRESLTGLYKHKLFKGNDLTHYPKHLQLCYTLLRESPLHVPDEVCMVDPEVRDIISLLHRQGVFEQATTLGGGKLNPFDNLGDRMKIIRKEIEPWFESLLDDDLKNNKKPLETPSTQGQPSSGEGTGDPSQPGNKSQPGDGDQSSGKDTSPSKSDDHKPGDQPGSDKGTQDQPGKEDDIGWSEADEGGVMSRISKFFGGGKGKKKKQAKGKQQLPGKNSPSTDPKKDQDALGGKTTSDTPKDKKPGADDQLGNDQGDQQPKQENPRKDMLNDGQIDHTIEDSLSDADFKKRVDSLNAKAKLLQAQESDPDKDLKQDARARAKSKKEFESASDDDPRLQEYINTLYEYLKFKRHHIEPVLDPESGQPLIQSLVDIFGQIISNRTDNEPIGYDGPVGINDNPNGLDESSFADGISRIKGGNLDAKMFTTAKDEQVVKTHVGVIDLYVVFDGSISMNEESKLYYQKICGLAIAEAMSESNHNLQIELGSADKSLICNHSYSIFHGNSVKQLKSHSSDFGDDERIKLIQGLSQTSGSTGDFKAVDLVTQTYQGFQDEHKRDLEQGTRKSIMIIITDGGSDDTTKLKESNKKARKAGLITIGVGVGSDGQCVETNYASEDRTQGTGVYCPEPKTLPVVAIHALKPHLEEE